MPRDQWAEARDRQTARRTKRRGGDEGYYLPQGLEVEVRMPGQMGWRPHTMKTTLRFNEQAVKVAKDGRAYFKWEGFQIRTLMPRRPNRRKSA